MEYCKNEVKKYKLSFLLLESTNMVTLSNYKFLNVFKALNMYITDWAVPLLGICPNKIMLVCTDVYHSIILMGKYEIHQTLKIEG